MTSLRRDPYLWLYLAGLATLPLWLDGCLAGLAVGDPVLPPVFEMAGTALLGSGLALWLQWQRPWYVFSLGLVSLRPDRLSPARLKVLALQRSLWSRLLSVLATVGLIGVLAWLYPLAPIAAPSTPFMGQSRAVGWLVSTIAFLGANLCLQWALSVIPALWVPARVWQQVTPYEVDLILQDFVVPGLRLTQILPDLVEPSMGEHPDQSLSEAVATELGSADTATEEKSSQVMSATPASSHSTSQAQHSRVAALEPFIEAANSELANTFEAIAPVYSPTQPFNSPPDPLQDGVVEGTTDEHIVLPSLTSRHQSATDEVSGDAFPGFQASGVVVSLDAILAEAEASADSLSLEADTLTVSNSLPAENLINVRGTSSAIASNQPVISTENNL